MGHAMKVAERAMDKRLSEIVGIYGMQLGFMKGK